MTDLNQYRIIVEEIKSIILQREELLTTRNRITASLNGMPGGGSDPHKIDTWIHRLIALDDQLDAEMDKLMEGNEQVRGLINRLPRSRGKNALLFHYINGLSVFTRLDIIAVIDILTQKINRLMHQF